MLGRFRSDRAVFCSKNGATIIHHQESAMKKSFSVRVGGTDRAETEAVSICELAGVDHSATCLKPFVEQIKVPSRVVGYNCEG